MASEMRNARDDFAAPVLDDLFCLVAEHLTCELQSALIFVGEADTDLQLHKLLKGDGRHGDFGGSVGISVNVFGDLLHAMLSFFAAADGGTAEKSPVRPSS